MQRLVAGTPLLPNCRPRGNTECAVRICLSRRLGVEWELHPGPLTRPISERPRAISAASPPQNGLHTAPRAPQSYCEGLCHSSPERPQVDPLTVGLLHGQGYDVAFQGPIIEDQSPTYTLIATNTSAVLQVTFVFMPSTSALATVRSGPKLEATAQGFLQPPLASQWRRTTFASPGRHCTAPFSDMCFRTGAGGTLTMRLTLESVPGPGMTVQLCVEIIDSDPEPKTAN